MPDDQAQTSEEQAKATQSPEPVQSDQGQVSDEQNQEPGQKIVMDIGPTEEEKYVIPAQTQNAAPAPKTPSPTQKAPAQKAPTAAVASKTQITLDQLINLCIEKEASDIHFGENSRVALRVRGNLVFIENIDLLSRENTQEMVFSMLPLEEDRRRLEHLRELDFSYTHSSGVNFRVNVFYQRGYLSVVMRMVSRHLPTIDELGIPPAIKKRLSLRKGLIVVAGTSGTGKSTTVQAMLEYINQNFVQHIITIENPIEYVFTNKKSIFSQREIGKDTLAVSNALHASLKEDPNVIMVSEINDLETLDSVLAAVEAGYLVITTMSTKDVKQTLERMSFMYSQSDQKHAQERISENVVAVVAQDLVNRTDRPGRVAVYELMLSTPGIRSIIKNGSLNQMRTAMQSGSPEGMVTMDAYAYHLGEQGIIDQDTAENFIEQE